MGRVRVVFVYQYPGKYACNVLAGALESRDETAHVPLRFPRSIDAVVDEVNEAAREGFTPLVVWSFYSASFASCVEQLAAVRGRAADAVHLAGGVHATAEPQQTLQGGFDLVCVGEGEPVIVELVSRLERGEPVEVTRGIARWVDERLVQNGRAEVPSLDAWPPFAPRSLRIGAIELTRGCIYACRFCQTPFMNRARFRHRSVDEVARWTRVLAEADVRDVRFISPTALSYGSANAEVNLPAVEALLGAVRRELGPSRRLYFGTFPSELRPEHVTDEALELLARFVDNDNLILGGQSGSDRVLEASHRGHDRAAIARAARLCVKHGFVPNVDFIFALPGEAADDVRQTLELMRELAALGAKVHGHTFMPLPGTPFKDAPAGRVEPDVQRELDRLASEGGVYGQWKRQAEIAERIAAQRRASRAG